MIFPNSTSHPSPSPAFQLFLAKARSLDLGPLAYQLMHSRTGVRWTKAETVRAIGRYLAFLYLVDQYPRLPLVPTSEIDHVWHQHILDTQKYAADCQQLFGHFIHHFPYLGTGGAVDQQQWYRAYALTQVLFRKHFGHGFASQPIPADCEPLQWRNPGGTGAQRRPTIALSVAEDCLIFAAMQN